ncbi:MAG: nitroreductase family protein [Syntrophales bacterium]|nr:nitroreductase family protein [Syntrophales bacterium]MCK9392317.1 nitroreductase family protein [Syntrophales bacterium]
MMKRIVISFLMCLLMSGLVYAKEDVTMKDAFSVIHARKSVRNFTGAPVSKADLDKILKAGMAAPTAVNMQPWSFIVIRERKILDDLAAGLPYAKMLTKAGAAIIVCTEPDKANGKSKDLAIIDAALAGENILLAIEALDLGGVWTAAYPYPDRIKHVKTVLKIPEEVIPLNVIAIGVPAGQDKPKDKYKKEKIHWEKW